MSNHLPDSPRIITSLVELRDAMVSLRSSGRKVGLVPTMGALHEGHLSLVRAARQECDFVAATIFVNPTQFAPHEDFDKYPRTLDDDVAGLRSAGTDLVFFPTTAELYPDGFSTFVQPPAVAHLWDGTCRPEHFRGVTTIVLKLFHLIPAEFAYFGQKDYQQCQVICRMVEDLNVPIKVRICPIVREPDGLAMSSRNRYLQPDQRQQALALSRALRAVEQAVQAGETCCAELAHRMHGILADAGITEVDYAVVADARTLAPLDRLNRPAVALVAARVGPTRLIDNVLLDNVLIDPPSHVDR